MTTYPPADSHIQWFYDDYHDAAFTSGIEKVVWHTTEGTSWPAYGGGSVAPHYTAYPDFKAQAVRWRAHFPDEVYSRALKNALGGVQTNIDGALQVEVIGTCDPKATWAGVTTLRSWSLPPWVIRDLGRFTSWVKKTHGVPYVYPSTWVSPQHAGDAQRFTGGVWDQFRGHCGHEHVPENDHRDPGAFQIAQVIAQAKLIDNPPPVTINGGSEMLFQTSEDGALWLQCVRNGNTVLQYVSSTEWGVKDVGGSSPFIMGTTYDIMRARGIVFMRNDTVITGRV